MTDNNHRSASPSIVVRLTRSEDIPGIIDLCERVYPFSPPWKAEQLQSHIDVFPEGQLVAQDSDSDRILGMVASLIVFWDDYGFSDDWRTFTGRGFFENHDPVNGKTLYGAEIMVDPIARKRGVGSALYAARFELAVRLSLKRIRAGARLRGYHNYSAQLTPEKYVEKVVRSEIYDPTLSFQLGRGFKVLGVVSDYLKSDPESAGCVAIIEWQNPNVSQGGV
jgi:GNAT superfamily N-acetyltransferase